jgi:hypothetical protein
MKVYLLIADRCPVLFRKSRQEVERFCAGRPDLKIIEFEIPSDLSVDNVKANLRDWYALKQNLAVKENTHVDEHIVDHRVQMHREFLKGVLKMMTADMPPTELMRTIEGQCQQPRCPGMMAYGMLSLQ